MLEAMSLSPRPVVASLHLRTHAAPGRAAGRVLLAALALAALSPGPAAAQVYRWTDDQGVIHYSTGIESVPERHRGGAEMLLAPTAPATPPASPAAAPAGAVTIPFAPGGPIRVSARINGAGPVTLVLDTGADRTMVSPAALAQLGIVPPGTLGAEVRGVAGAARADVLWVSSLEVGEAALGPMAIVALDAGVPGADGLLGRDFLGAFTVTIDAAASAVTFTPLPPP
jgi:predicted aspartyl protease